MRPAQTHQISGIVQLDGPVYDVALVILHIQINLTVRIGPNESRDSSLQGNPFRKIVSLGAVVSGERAAKQQSANRQGKKLNRLAFHATPRNLESTAPANSSRSWKAPTGKGMVHTA